MESYKHAYAKNALAGWLRAEHATPDCDLKPWNECLVGARTNRSAPYFGVYTEYPVCIDKHNQIRGFSDPWDETGPFNRIPTYQECLNVELLPLVVFDVIVLHKGQIDSVFEVVHKHDISDQKRLFINRLGNLFSFEVHVLDADWILSQATRPTRKYQLIHKDHWVYL